MKPSHFSSKYPWSSVFGKAEHEVIARNIMVILERTGNKFRKISFKEYKEERLKYGNWSEIEKIYFDDVVNYCKNAKAAKSFSEEWNK